MNTKSFFAAGLIAAAASAINAVDASHKINKHHEKLRTPRVTLTGPYWQHRPYYATPEPEEEEAFHVSTDDDRYSSSDSDSVSSSDFHESTQEEEGCERDGDIYACLRKQNAAQCDSTQTFNADTCLCNEKYTCRALADAYGKSTCPAENYGLTPYTSPLDNCACQSQAEYDAMYNYEFAGHCAHAPAFKPTHAAVNKIRVCASDTDSDSDCVKIGGLRRAVKGSYDRKQRDDQGNVDSSIYTDSDCNPAYSSCDTNSNEEFSNTDSNSFDSQAEEKVTKKAVRANPLGGRLADRYAKKYGVKLAEPLKEKKSKKHHGYGHDNVIDTRSVDTDSDITSYDGSNPGQAATYNLDNVPDGDGDGIPDTTNPTNDPTAENAVKQVDYNKSERRRQDPNRSDIDECDSDDIAPGCGVKPEQPESEDYEISEDEVSLGLPSKGTSNSSNSTNDPDSDSDSLKNSSSEDEEEEAVAFNQCAQVWFEPANGSSVWGWANLWQPAEGAYAGNTLITAKFENLEGAGVHGFHIHETGDLAWECKATGAHYLPDGERIGELQDYADLRASWREEASYYSWNPVVKLDGDYSVLGRSIVVHALDGTRVGCGRIEPGCSPCADGTCRQPPVEKEKVWKPRSSRHY